MQNETLAKFGKAFQENLVHLILEDREYADQMQELLDVNFLELRYLQVFVQKIFKYREKYKSHPTQDSISTILKSEKNGEDEVVSKQIRDYYSRILPSGEVKESDFIKDVSIEFCKKQKLKEAILKSAELINKSSYDEIKVLIDTALKLGLDNNFGYDYLIDFEKRYQKIARKPISTGWSVVDNITGGGLGIKELGVVVSYTGGGKSMALVHLGAIALKAGKNVVYYTLELQDTVIAQRFDSCLTRIPLSSLIDYKDDVYEKISNLPGKLIIKEYSSKSATVNTLRSHLDKLKKNNFNVDMIIVDYGDLLNSVKNYKEKRQELESIYEDLRSMAQEYECPTWSCSQCNRSGLNSELITMDAISEAYNKCFVADFIFSISRTVEDKNNNAGRVFIAKNRNGPDYLIFPIMMDTSIVKLDVKESNGDTVKSVKKESLKQKKERLKEQYKEFKKEQDEK